MRPEHHPATSIVCCHQPSCSKQSVVQLGTGIIGDACAWSACACSCRLAQAALANLHFAARCIWQTCIAEFVSCVCPPQVEPKVQKLYDYIRERGTILPINDYNKELLMQDDVHKRVAESIRSGKCNVHTAAQALPASKGSSNTSTLQLVWKFLPL